MGTQAELPGAIELLAREASGKATGVDFVNWAVRSLEAGVDAPAIRQLAGLDLDGEPRLCDAVSLFRRAATELGISLPETKAAALNALFMKIASGIADGAIDPIAGLGQIHERVLFPLGHPAHLMAWCYLNGGIDPQTFHQLDQSAVAVQALARRAVYDHDAG